MRTNATVWATVALAIAGVAGIVALEALSDGDSQPLMLVLIGFLAPTVAALLNTQKVDQANAKLSKIDGRLNGELDARIEAAVAKALGTYHAATSEDCADPSCKNK